MTTPFWLSNPTILFKQDNITQLWPLQRMSSEEKLNSITRLVIILTLLGYLITKTKKIIITGAVTLAAIIILYKIQSMNLLKKINSKEAFMNINMKTNPEIYNLIKDNYTQPTETNPAMNVLLTDIADNPDRKAAAPAYNSAVETEMNNKTMEFVSNNFNDPNIDERLFKDLGDNYEFDQSMRTWYATPNTRVMNDQKSFAEYCYGDMISCKEGNDFACTRNAPPRWTNY
jgi:hypothetical protein